MRFQREYSCRMVLLFLVLCSILTGGGVSAKAAAPHFTREERDYIAEGVVLKAASIDGGAPLHYLDSKGEIKGIAVEVLREIAALSGLIIEYRLYDSIDEAANSGADIFFGVTKGYATPGTILSKPYLISEAILYYNVSLDPNRLDGKRFAAIKGGTLPEGISEDNTIFYKDREEALDAVETGKADYGIGNAYSVAFYTLQNDYKNIISIPREREEREYCIGLAGENALLLSIINKSIEAIDEKRMQTLILDVTSQVERKITLSAIVEAYGREIIAVIFMIVAVLLVSVILNVRANRRLELQNRRYEILSSVSNEFLFEYGIKTRRLELSRKFSELIDLQEGNAAAATLLKDLCSDLGGGEMDEKMPTIELPLADGGRAVFKVIFSRICNESGKPYSIIGKLVDISEEVSEKEKLLTKSRLDGLTGLYNAATAREMIKKSMKANGKGKKDALIIIDCDNFKKINDTYGHLEGDLVLKNISKALQFTFRQSDILGRIGGDEFSAYLHGVPSVDFVISRCWQLVALIQKLNEDFAVTVSVGLAIFEGEKVYEELFMEADSALYFAKMSGGAHIAVYEYRGRFLLLTEPLPCHSELLPCHPERSEGSRPARPRTKRPPGHFP